MPENTDNSNIKPSINLSRNSPAALVVGAAGFLGSHVSHALLTKSIEVVGLDNFSTGRKENLQDVIKDGKFHLVNSNGENLQLNLERLDYIFIVAGVNWDISGLLKLALKYSSKIVFISHINLYEAEVDKQFNWYKKAESEISKFASDNKLNSRIIRLGPVYGPRMSFNIDDPLFKLITSSVDGKLQNEADSLEFSSRALYISDATNLILKSMLAGGTAMKIFDGVGEPVKISEVKQVLLDPIWYENRGFKPSQLPPWPTPNLEKTKKYLNWEARSNLVTSLRETLSYFKDHEASSKMPEKNKETTIEVVDVDLPKMSERELWEQEKLRRLAVNDKVEREKRKEDKSSDLNKGQSNYGQKFLVFIGLLIIIYGFFYPLFSFGWGVISYRQNLQKAASNLSEGEFQKSLNNISDARSNLNEVSNLVDFFQFLDKVDFLSGKYQAISQLTLAGTNLVDASQKAIEGSQALSKSLQNISGENSQITDQYFIEAKVNFNLANSNFSKVLVILHGTNLQVLFIDSQLELLKNRVEVYSKLTKKAGMLSQLLPRVIGQNEERSYLIMLQDENQLKSYGGVIVSAVKLNFKQGRVGKIEAVDQAKINSIKLVDEPDFPTVAKQLISELGDKSLNGIVIIDLHAMAQLMEGIGGVKLTENIDLNAGNLVSSAANQKVNAKTYQNLLTEFLGKIFFVPKINWIELTLTLDEIINEKNMSVYLTDPKLFTFLVDQGLSGKMSRQTEIQSADFLGLIESNIGQNSVNYYIQKSSELETNIKDKLAVHNLMVSYQNGSKDLNYRSLIRVYLPEGAKLNKAKLGESEIKEITTISDYGRVVYSFTININPATTRMLSLDYSVPLDTNFAKSPYLLDIFKQSGIPSTQFHWNLSSPIIYSTQAQLSKDLQFSIGL